MVQKNEEVPQKKALHRSANRDKVHVVINRYLWVVIKVQVRQQSHHDAYDPRVHDHDVTIIHPAKSGKTGCVTWPLFVQFSRSFFSKTGDPHSLS